MAFIDRMQVQDYIDATRQYLDYVEEHVQNVAKAFDELSLACDGKEWWVGDDFAWHTIRAEVERHDLSKLSKDEFVQYRDNFYPVTPEDKKNSGFDEAWENHKASNPHHHETVGTYNDIVHMVIDWIAMSYKFGDNPREFYEKTKPAMNIKDEWHREIENLFCHLEAHRKVS